VTLHGLKVGTNGGAQCVDVTIRRLEDSGALEGLIMIVFTDVAAPAVAKATGQPKKPKPAAARG